MQNIAHRLRMLTCCLLIGKLLGGSALLAQEALNQPASVYARPAAQPDSSDNQEQPYAQPDNTTETVAPPAHRNSKPIPLAPPRERATREPTAPHLPTSTSTITTVISSLAIVLGLFFVTAWFLRRNLPKGMTLLPGEVLEQLGRAPLAGKQQMHLVRVGHKLILLVVTPSGAETLTEITDPSEVDRLCGLCRQHGAHGPSAEFRAVLRQFEREPAGPGFLGDNARSDVELASAGSPARRPRTRGSFDA